MNVSLRELERLIGPDQAAQLVARAGGIRVYLPRPENVTPGSRIAAIISVDAAKILCAVWACERITIPVAKARRTDARDQEMLAERARFTIPQLARRYAMTETGVYRALARARAKNE